MHRVHADIACLNGDFAFAIINLLIVIRVSFLRHRIDILSYLFTTFKITFGSFLKVLFKPPFEMQHKKFVYWRALILTLVFCDSCAAKLKLSNKIYI